MTDAAVWKGLLQAGVNHMPAREHAVVTGSPDDEGNSVEVVRGLANRLPVYWLVGSDPQSLSWLLSGAAGADRVRFLHRSSSRAFWAYMTARYVFFTHGLYGSSLPPPHKVYVNLWHGDGPKQRKLFATIRSTFVVSGTELWGANKARSFGVGESGLLVTGNPRVDQFSRPADDERLLALGLDPAKPLVLWLPTFRGTRYRGARRAANRNWTDTDALSAVEETRNRIVGFAAEAESMGFTLAVKPHPLDADEFTSTGMRVVTNEALRAAHTTVYQLLARTRGLVTDYSSVWTDYLALDRPIGFYCPDLAAYTVGRGLNVDDLPSLLPGPLIATRQNFTSFLRSCIDEPECSKQQRDRSVSLIGAETQFGATQRLLDAVLPSKIEMRA